MTTIQPFKTAADKFEADVPLPAIQLAVLFQQLSQVVGELESDADVEAALRFLTPAEDDTWLDDGARTAILHSVELVRMLTELRKTARLKRAN